MSSKLRENVTIKKKNYEIFERISGNLKKISHNVQ